MPEINKAELSKLKPADRIRKLKEIAEQSRKEILEAEKIINESEREIETIEVSKKVSVPESKRIEISDLFEPPPKTLEQKAEEGAELKHDQIQYMVNQAYSEAADLAYQEPSKEVLDKVDALGERLEKINYRTLSDDVANRVVATRSIIYKIKKSHQQEPPRW
ncbi:MAG: hypothetical protein ABIC04_06600 [Nanoarchaeota archaeon]